MERCSRGVVRALLDTHVLLRWVLGDRRLSSAHCRVIRLATESDPLLVSDISVWEVASLQERGRIRINVDLRDWLERAVAPPLVELCGITPAVGAEITRLPLDWDPADRIIVATARVRGAVLLTEDGRIAASGAVGTL